MGLSYIICTAPRTGSTLLAEALKATGCAGRPAEYFDIHAHNEQYWIRTLGIRNDAEYIEKVVEAGTTSNGVFGLKVHFHQLRAVHAKLLAAAQSEKVNGPAMSVEALLRARFGEPRYIWLMRRNKSQRRFHTIAQPKPDSGAVSARKLRIATPWTPPWPSTLPRSISMCGLSKISIAAGRAIFDSIG
jgi:LPS sulfotransferase NodH